MMILLVVAVLSASSIQIAMMTVRGSRSDRDMEIAFQSAEAALLDAEYDILGKPDPSKKRSVSIKNAVFSDNCSDSSGQNIGLCKSVLGNGKSPWIVVDLANTDTNAKAVAFGTFTGRAFPSGEEGIQPAKLPRYIIERVDMPDVTLKENNCTQVYRITAMGFGANKETQAVLQTTYCK